VVPDRPPRGLAIKVEADRGADHEGEVEVGPRQVVPVGDVVRAAKVLDHLVELGALERLVPGLADHTCHRQALPDQRNLPILSTEVDGLERWEGAFLRAVAQAACACGFCGMVTTTAFSSSSLP